MTATEFCGVPELERAVERRRDAGQVGFAAQTLLGPELTRTLYDQLRELAAAYLAVERRNHTLQPTALVHEAYLRMAELTDIRWRDETHFFAAAAGTLRRVLADHAKGHDAKKRGGGQTILELTDVSATDGSVAVDVVDLDEALRELSARSARQARIVELRFFGGLEFAEVAAIIGVSERTVYADWHFARAWLAVRLKSLRP